MTNKTEALATVFDDIENYVRKHADEIPEYMHPAFLQVPSLEDDEVKDFQGGGEVENPNPGTPVSSIYTGIEYDEQGRPIVDTYPMDREEQTRSEGMLNIEAMSDKAFVKYFGKGLLGIGIKEQLGIPKVLSAMPPVDPKSILTAGFALVGDKLSKSLAEGALKGKYTPDEQIGILQDVVDKYSPVNKQDSEFFRGIPQPTTSPTYTMDWEPTTTQPDIPSRSQPPKDRTQAETIAYEATIPKGPIGPLGLEQQAKLNEINERHTIATNKADLAREKDLEQSRLNIDTGRRAGINVGESKEKTVGFQSRAEQEALAAAAEKQALNTDTGRWAGINVGANKEKTIDFQARAEQEALAAAPEQQAMDREVQDQALAAAAFNAGVDAGTSDVSVDAPSRSGPDEGHGGAFNKGGPANMQLGGEAENADTDLEVANIPMGVVSDRDGAPGPFRGGTGVEDDLEMEVEAGSYILNAEAVQLVGISDINKVIRDAYTIAAKLGKPLPEDYDPQNKVPIRISNQEAVIPKSLVDIIGLDKLEKWNQKGLQLRKQKEKMQAKQQPAPPQGPQVAPEAPPVQPQSPMQAQMGGLMIKPVGEGSTVLSDEELDEALKELPLVTDSPQEESLDALALKIEDDKVPELPSSGGYGYGIGISYTPEDMDSAIEEVSKVLGTNSSYQKRTATFLREIANAESTYGRDTTTNKKISNIVGPWQVGMNDNQAYAEIKRRLDPNYKIKDRKGNLISGYRPKLKANLDEFKKTSWGKDINWENLSKRELMNPLVNATIARLYISTIDNKPIPATKAERAKLWADRYNTKADKLGTYAYYMSKNP